MNKLLLSIMVSCTVLSITAQNIRSALYPTNWEPGYTDSEGRFLHDFSYAGYRGGLVDLPAITSPIVNITQAPYNADNTGTNDVTDIIQQAIDNLPASGGVVYLPAGEYKVSVPSSRSYGIIINKDNVVIRGDGPALTKIKNVSYLMRSKVIFLYTANDADWTNTTTESLLTKNVMKVTNQVEVANSTLFRGGDWVVVKNDITDEFIEEHKSTGYWAPGKIASIHFCRQIVSIDATTNTLTLDAPTLYPVKKRDNARVAKLKPQLMECGMEDLSIGNIQHPGTGLEENDYSKTGTVGYDVHDSYVISIRNAVNGWFKNVHTYRPAENSGNIHVVSNGFHITRSRGITAEDCDFRNSQYEGGGGNGYMYVLAGNNCLLKNCYAEDGRHNYSFKTMIASGNVLYNCYSKNSHLTSDFHMYLSMANLIDGFQADGDRFSAGYRTAGSAGSVHMYTTTESVFWNTTAVNRYDSEDHVINSRQFGNGYVIGTRGEASIVRTKWVAGTAGNIYFDTSPEDFTEAVGSGQYLRPQSLYADQLEKRRLRTTTGITRNAQELRKQIRISYLDNGLIELNGFDETISDMNLVDALGRVVKHIPIDGRTVTLNTSGINKGVYFLCVNGTNHIASTLKLLVR